MALTETMRMNITGMHNDSLWVIVETLTKGMSDLTGDDMHVAGELINAACEELRRREQVWA